MDLVKNLLYKGLLHCFIWNHEGFLFDPTSNSVFSCSPGDVNDIQEEHPSEELLQDIEALAQKGFFHEEQGCFEDQRIYKSLCFIMTRGCNFRCPYCFEKGKSHFDDEIMSLPVIEKAFDFLVNHSGDRKVLECDFFGGEPLLAWDRIQKAIELSQSITATTGKKFRFSLTTNASLLSPVITQYLYEHDISLILSQDGLPENHNRFRISSQRKPTYDEVMNAILPVAQNWKEGYYVRGTYTKKNLHFLKDIQHLYSKGIQKISFEPVVSEHEEIGFQTHDMVQIKEEYQALSRWVLGTMKKDPNFSFYHFELNLTHGACKEKLMTSCGAGVEYVSVSPTGELFPCHQFDNNPSFKIGDVFQGVYHPRVVETFKHSTNILSKPLCQTCWARYICGGGCSANNYRMNGNLFTPWEIGCDIQKIRIEAALYVQVKKRKRASIQTEVS